MKNLSLLKLMMMALAIFALSSCGDDTDDVALDPSISFLDEAGFISIDSDIAAGTEFSVKLRGSTGDNPLSSLTIQEDFVDIDFSRITYAHTTTANNPQLVVDADKEGFEWEVTIVAHSDAANYTYDFILRDDAGNSSIASININTAGSGPPTISIDGPTAIQATGGSAQIVKINSTPGGAQLRSVAVYEDGTLMDDLTRLDYWGVAFVANPLTLEGDDKNGLTSAEITLRVADAGAPIYTFEVEDELGETATIDFSVAIGTPLDVDAEVTAILFYNNDGPNQGGVDLEDGQSISSLDNDADIVDMGINTDLPVGENWLQQVAPANGAALSLPNGSVELFDYDNIDTKEAVIAAYESGDAAANTPALVVGDVFMVNQGGDYFICMVREINVTAADNLDNYVIDIKRVLD